MAAIVTNQKIAISVQQLDQPPRSVLIIDIIGFSYACCVFSPKQDELL